MILPLLFLSVVPAAAQESVAGKYFVKDGKTDAVFYGMSAGPDIWGNFSRKVWTLRSDGTLLMDIPEGSFEAFIKRDLSAEEKTAAVRYAIEGGKFHIYFNNGSTGSGTVEYAPDGSLKLIIPGGYGMYFYPILLGLGTPLSGYWSNSFSFKSPSKNVETNFYSNFSFYDNGLFVLGSGSGTIAMSIEARTRESEVGNLVLTETIRREVTSVYGGNAPSKMGKFEVQGSSLLLSYDDGKKETSLIGRLGPVKAGEPAMILIGRNLYEGTLGVFPKKEAATGAAPAAVPPTAPAAGLGRCRNAQFDLAVTAGWHARQEDLQGLKAFLLTPAGVSADDPEGKFTLMLTSTVLTDRTTQAADATTIALLEALVTSWCKDRKVEKEGGTEKFKMGGADAVRVRYSLPGEGVPVKIEVACAVRDGNALVALTVASETAIKRHGGAARELLATAVLAAGLPEAKVELQRVKGDGYELDVPKAWTVREMEQGGRKSLVIVPPSGEAEYVVQVLPSNAGDYSAATDAGAVQELRNLVKQIAPALEAVGSPETLKAGGQPAAGVVYGGRNEKNEVILVKAYLTLKARRAVVVLVVGKETRDKEYGALVRRALESLTLK
jgi:hypothetical protein